MPHLTIHYPFLLFSSIEGRKHPPSASAHRHDTSQAAASKVSSSMIMMIVTWQKEEEARESQECIVFDKVNGLRVALCFGGCRVLGCIIVVVFMVCE